MCECGEAQFRFRLCLLSDLVQLCRHSSPTSECRKFFARRAAQPAPLLPNVRGFPTLRVLSASPTSTVASVSLRLVHSVDILGPLPPDQDSGGSPRCHDASISVHAVLLDPAGVSSDHRHFRSPTVAFQIFDPVGLRMLREAQSLHLRYGLDIALSTLNSCRYLHEPKTRFPVRRLVPFPGRELPPLEAPGLSWRTEVGPQVKIDGSCFSLIDRFGHSVYRFMRCPFRPVSIRPRLEISFEDRFQDELECSLDHAVADRGNREDADLGAPILRYLLLPCSHRPIRV